MNEISKITFLIEREIDKTQYTNAELDIFADIFNNIIGVMSELDKVRNITESQIKFLLNKKMITKDEETCLKEFINKYNNRVYIKEDEFETFNAILRRILKGLTDINNVIPDINYNEIMRRVNHKFNELTIEDYDVIFQLIIQSNYSDEEKRELLLYISNILYNRKDIFDNAMYEKGISDEELKNVFANHNHLEYYELLKEKSKKRLLKEGVYDIIDGILTILDKYKINLCNNYGINILNEKQDNIVEILINSNREILDHHLEVYQKCCELKENETINFYWLILNPYRLIATDKPYKEKNKGNTHKPGSLSVDKSNTEDHILNMIYFTDMCKRIYGEKVNFIKLLMKNGNGTLLDYRHEKILKIVETFKLYGLEEKDFFECATSIFKVKNPSHILDIAVELDCLDYLKQNQSRISSVMLKRPLEEYLYIASKHGLFTTIKRTNFAGTDAPLRKQLNIKAIEDYLDKNPNAIPLKYEDLDAVKKDFQIIDENIENRPFNINRILNNIDSDEYLTILENNFKVNDSLYEIAGIRISRIKVLRVYNALLGINIMPNLKFTYAISRHSFITLDEMQKIMLEINKMKGKKI